MENFNPKLHTECDDREVTSSEKDEFVRDEIDEREIFDMIRDINDPEHPLTLEQLNVVQLDHIQIENKKNYMVARVEFTPTIPHCSMATLIGLSIKVQLSRSLPSNYKTVVEIREGTHVSQGAINKQLADKERVAAALENPNLNEVLNQALATNRLRAEINSC